MTECNALLWERYIKRACPLDGYVQAVTNLDPKASGMQRWAIISLGDPFQATQVLAYPIGGLPAEEPQSVVSVYTTQPTTAGTAPLDVYHQIANNIAERITSPIYKFLGIAKNKTDSPTTTKNWSTVELLDDPDTIKTIKPLSNDISTDRDVEEVSEPKRVDRKPEKITLYSSYLPQRLEATTITNQYKPDNSSNSTNKTINDINVDDDDEPFEFDDVEKAKENDSVGGPFVYFLELVGSIIQLAWGAIQALFAPKAKTT